jgi:hypothetical protein
MATPVAKEVRKAPRMKNLLVGLLTVTLSLISSLAWACRVCRPRVQATIHTPDYTGNLLVLLLPIAVLLAGGVGLYFAADIKRYFLAPKHG